MTGFLSRHNCLAASIRYRMDAGCGEIVVVHWAPVPHFGWRSPSGVVYHHRAYEDPG